MLDVDLPQAPQHIAGVEGPGDAAGAADVNTGVPVLEAAIGFRRDLAPAGFVELRRADEGNRGLSYGFTLGLPLAAEPAPARNFGTCNEGRPYFGCAYVRNNGRAVAVDGRQPYLPVGFPAVNSGSVVWATPCLALWRPPAAGWPAALCGSWLWQGSGLP